MKTRLFIFLSTVLFMGISAVARVDAAGATILPDPNTGSFGKPFTVNVVVNGQGDKFNAAQAAVALSSNLKIKDLSLGDCNFSFLHTPTVQNPSFAGVIIQSYSTKCTAYTLSLLPAQTGKATISLSKGSVKRYGDAKEILSGVSGGTYTLTAAVKDTSGNQGDMNPSNGLYALNLKVYTSGTTPAQQANVTLGSVDKTAKQQATTGGTGTARFTNLKPGVYDVTVNQGFGKVGETIVNVSGVNHTLTLSMDLSAQKNNPLMKAGSILASLAANPAVLVGALVVGVILGVGIALGLVRYLGPKKHHAASA